MALAVKEEKLTTKQAVRRIQKDYENSFKRIGEIGRKMVTVNKEIERVAIAFRTMIKDDTFRKKEKK